MICPACKVKNDANRTTCIKCNAILAQHLPSGYKLANERYTVGQVLGEGGFGVTYKGLDNILGRSVAIKELFPEGATRVRGKVIPPRSLGLQGFAQSKTSFKKEASRLSKFDHKGIVHVFDVVEDNNTTYLIMEFLEGKTLAQVIGEKGKLSPEVVLLLANKVASALQVVHEAQLLHRDIKPENIFLTNDERAVLIDFGSARQFTLHKTSNHTRLVTPGYAPYEQYVSEAKFGPYTDIYALGATLYYALSGQIPPDAPSRALNDNLVPLPSNTPSNLSQAINASMAIKIDSRPANSLAFIALLNKPSPKLTTPKSPIRNPKGKIVVQELGTLKGHNDYVNSVTFSPKGDLLASGSSDATVKLWQVSAGKSLKTFSRRNGPVFSVAFSPDGNTLVSQSANNKISLRQVRNRKKIKTLPGHDSLIYSIAFNHNGTLLASGSDDYSVKLWQIKDGKNLNTFLGHEHSIFSVTFGGPEGDILASGSGDNTIKLWQVSDGALLTTLSGHSDYVFSVAFSPKGDLLASGSMDGTVKLWKVKDGTLLRTFLGHESWVWSVTFNASGDVVASGSEDKAIKLWRVRDGKNLSTLLGHDSFVYSVAFSTSGEILASGSGDKTIKLWEIE